MPSKSEHTLNELKNIGVKGLFQLPPLDKSDRLVSIPMVKMSNTSNLTLKYKGGVLKLLPNQQYNLFFYKGTGLLNLKLLDSMDNILESIRLPNNEGMVVVNMKP